MKQTISALSGSLLIAVLASCGLSSEGTELKPITEADEAEVIGQEHAITLEHKNVYFTSKGPYIRAEDDDRKGIDLYYSKDLASKVYNLEPGAEYIYKFKVIEGGKYPDGQLLEVADREGSIISSSIDVPETAMRVPFLQGEEAFGKEFTVKARYSSSTTNKDGEKIAYFRDPDGYQFSLVGYYTDDLAETIDGLERKEYMVTFKRRSEIYGGLKGDLIAVKPAE